MKIKKIAAALLNEALGSICPAERFSGTGFSLAGDGSQVCAAPGDGLPKKKKNNQTLKGVVWSGKPNLGRMIGSIFSGITFPRGRGCWVGFISPSLSCSFAKPSPGVGEEGGLPFPLGLQSSKLKKDSYVLARDLYLTGRYISLSPPVL